MTNEVFVKRTVPFQMEWLNSDGYPALLETYVLNEVAPGETVLGAYLLKDGSVSHFQLHRSNINTRNWRGVFRWNGGCRLTISNEGMQVQGPQGLNTEQHRWMINAAGETVLVKEWSLGRVFANLDEYYTTDKTEVVGHYFRKLSRLDWVGKDLAKDWKDRVTQAIEHTPHDLEVVRIRHGWSRNDFLVIGKIFDWIFERQLMSAEKSIDHFALSFMRWYNCEPNFGGDRLQFDQET